MTTMMRSVATALVLAAAVLVQGCSSTGVTQQSMAGPNTGVYSGDAWYADLNNVMTTDSSGE